MSHLIRADKLSKKYNKNQILEDVSFRLDQGLFYTLLGANGAGKSTLLRILSGVELPDAGEVHFQSYPIQSWDIPHKNDLFYINENIQIETGLTLKKFASYLKDLFPRWDEPFFQMMIKTRAFDLNKFYNQCSRGQKMQYNMMMALAANPKILLLDEITSVMDVYTRRYFLQLLHEFTKKGGTVIMTTNIISELEFYTDHLFFLHRNKLIINEEMENLRRQIKKIAVKNEHTSHFTSKKDILWVGLNRKGEHLFILPEHRFTLIENNSFEFNESELTLEDIFIYYSYVGEVKKNHENAA